jgi:ENTS family enterobactin (siderophore) exporter
MSEIGERLDAGEAAGEIVGGLPATPVEAPGGGDRERRRGSVWAIRDYRIVALGEGISGLGDAITFTALPLLVLALTGSGAAMGIVAALQTLPDLLLGLPLGAYADRWDRRRMMLFSDLGRAALTALIPLSVALDLPTMGVVLLVVFPINALRVAFMAAWTGAIPNLVGRSLIGPATSYFEAIFALGFILGPGIAGLLVTVIGPGPTLAIDAASFCVSAAALWFVRTSMRDETANRETRHLVAEIRDGVAFVARHPTLRAAVGYWTATGVATAALIPVLVYFMTVDLRLGADSLGFVISAFSLGSLGGSLAAAQLTRGRLGILFLAGIGFTGLVLIVVSTLSSPLAMAGVAFLAGTTNSIGLIAYVTIRASSTPDALLGRVGATTRMLSVGLQPLGAAGAGLLLDAVAGGPTLALMGLIVVVATIAFAFVGPLRNARAPRVDRPAAPS